MTVLLTVARSSCPGRNGATELSSDQDRGLTTLSYRTLLQVKPIYASSQRMSNVYVTEV